MKITPKKHSPEAIQKFKELASNREYLPGVEVEITDI